MTMETIGKNVYESPHSWERLQALGGISAGFMQTIRDWITDGNVVEITKDRLDNCLGYSFRINSSETPKPGQLVITEVD